MSHPKDEREFVHRVDKTGCICFVNDAWRAFAAENDWGDGPERVLGTRWSDHVSDPETRHLYGLLMDRARKEDRPLRVSYRCDSPDCRRFMEMHIGYHEASGEVELRSRVLRLERRPPVALLGAHERNHSGQILTMCSWCKGVQVGDDWMEIERAVESLRLFSATALPRLSHGICPSCSRRVANWEIQHA